MSLERTTPRVLGALALIFPLAKFPLATAYGTVEVWALYTTLWLIPCVALLFSPKHTRVAAGALAALAVVGVFWPIAVWREPYSMIAWVAFIVAWTVGRPDERALLLKVCVTAVYAFTAMAKLNPDFLNGEQLLYLVNTRPHLEIFRPILESGWGSVLAAGTVLTEGALPALLWWRGSRRYAVLGGAVLHTMLIGVALIDVYGFLELVVLNGLVVLGYAGFLHDMEPVAARRGRHRWQVALGRVGARA